MDVNRKRSLVELVNKGWRVVVREGGNEVCGEARGRLAGLDTAAVSPEAGAGGSD